MIEEQPAPRVNRRLLLALAGLAGVVLGLLLLGSVFGGNGEQAVGRPPRPAGTSVPETSGPEAPPPGADPTSLLAGGRDPFEQIVTVPAQIPPVQPPSPTQGVPPADGPPAEGPVETPSASKEPFVPGSDATGSTPDQPPGDSGHASLELISIFPDGAGVDRATIIVDGQSFSPARGEVFSYGFRLEHLDARCVEVSAPTARAQMCLPAAMP